MNAELEMSHKSLLENLGALQMHLRELVQQARRKLAAVRTADARTLHEIAREESELLERVQRNQRQREAALARLANAMRRPEARCMTLSALAEHLSEPSRSSLLARSAALRSTSEELQRINGVVGGVTRALHGHIQSVFDAVARFMQETVVYGPRGQHEARRNRVMVDAIG